MRTLSLFLVLCLLAGCSDKPERKDVKEHSIFLGKEVFSHAPMVFVKNLPHVEEVSRYVAVNSFILLAEEASRRVVGLRNICANCLDARRLVSPLRIEYIPIGTRFSVVGEYRYYHRGFPFSDSNIHMLLIQDDRGNISEIPEYSFDGYFIREHEQKPDMGAEDRQTLRILDTFNDADEINVNYCPYLDIVNNQDISKFIKDFSLEGSIKISSSTALCEEAVQLTFSDPDSFLTARYYFQEWQLYGRWYEMPTTKKFQSPITDEGTLKHRVPVDLQVLSSFSGIVKKLNYYSLQVPDEGSYDLLFSFDRSTRLQFSAFDQARFGTIGISCAHTDRADFECSLNNIKVGSGRQIDLGVVNLAQKNEVMKTRFEVSIRYLGSE